MIPTYGDKYDAEALFTPAEVIEAQGGDPHADVPPVAVVTFQTGLFEWIREERAGDPIPIVRSQEVYPVSETVGVIGDFGIGAPVTAAVAENLVATGAEVLCIVGGGAALQRDIEPTDVIVPDRAIRDEGVSYHYLPPEAEATATPALADHLEAAFRESDLDTHRGTTWTTSAFYRETVDEVAHYAGEGVVSLEMEAAALFAVAEFRGVESAAVFDVGDLLTEEEWDDGQEYEDVHPQIFDHAVEALTTYVGGS